MKHRKLGNNGPSVSAIGYGAMVLVHGMYGEVEDTLSVKTIQHVIDSGITMIDTADAYANGHNEELVGQAIKDRRDKVFLATKFGIVFDANETSTPVTTNWNVLPINGKPEYVRKAIDGSLNRLGVDYLDLWYAHFPDPSTPIEDTVSTMAEVVQAGKVKYLGLSNVTAEQLRRAHAVHPITAVQYEYSLWSRNAETDLLPTARELGVGFVPWAPLGSGFLTGTVKSVSEGDFRNFNPRYQGENLKANQDRFAPIKAMAEELNVTPAQLALAWLLHKDEHIVPIPGSRNPVHIDSNAMATEISLTPEQLKLLDTLAPRDLAAGKTLL
ncbi:aldo/keto reductase [Neobacillus massiliamazoniensis]|uniref:Aldo-keto reductase YakC n=1 Tax=Neobacillus massiliamazoniensis TaxID=1499688 RepID=A0A0U1NXU3_9BACI|nr:aldo/keto reductase [Neobacillus massiliamazoniensis]CRK82859.1 Aldo-keto reductase YakC [Neobacillus massiliamazoniensis]